MTVSFLILNLSTWVGIAILGMILITIGEMMAFPFTNNFAMNRAPKGKEGRYLAMYSMAFSMANIFSAKTGMEIIDRFGFQTNWFLMVGIGVLAIFLAFWLKRELNKI